MKFPSEYEPNLFYNHQNREPGDQQAHTHTHTHTHTILQQDTTTTKTQTGHTMVICNL